MGWVKKLLASATIVSLIGLGGGGSLAAATPTANSNTCGALRALQRAIVTTEQPAGEPETYVCPTWMASTAVVGAPYGQGATAWGGRAFLTANEGVTWHGYEYNLYETFAPTYLGEVAAAVPAGFNVNALAQAWRPFNYVAAGLDSSSWEIGAFWAPIGGLVVPEYAGEPVPWTPITQETSPYSNSSRIW